MYCFKVLVTINIILGSQSVSGFVNHSCLMDVTFFGPSPIVQAIDTNFYAVCSQQEVKNVMGQLWYGRGTSGQHQ